VLIGFFVIPKSAIAIAWLVALLCGPGIATAAVIPWSMLPDVIEQEQQHSGERREGSYYAFISFFQKLGTGLALWMIGLSLSASGYVTPDATNQFPDQPESVLATIRFIIGPVAILLLLVSLPFAWKYPITRQSHRNTLAMIPSSKNSKYGNSVK
jgi:GPH family glycoside/pentoside/hexuronide:cation symporter